MSGVSGAFDAAIVDVDLKGLTIARMKWLHWTYCTQGKNSDVISMSKRPMRYVIQHYWARLQEAPVSTRSEMDYTREQKIRHRVIRGKT